MFLEEREDLLPAIHRLFLAIRRAIVIEKSMSGAVVAMKLIIFSMLFELRFVLIDLLRRRRFVIIAEQTDHRTREVLGVIDRRHRLLRCQLLFRLNHASAPAL